MRNTDWEKAFTSAGANSWPTETLLIQNCKPPNGRNIYAEDKAEIHAAAKRHGFRMLGGDKGKAVCFIKTSE